MGPCRCGGAFAPVLGKTQVHDLVIAMKGERTCSRSSQEVLAKAWGREGRLPAGRRLRPQPPCAQGSMWNRGER